ncbi:MarR family transcriptional regulator [Kutzneria sp. NPDC051319]|uniref:MarR family winged helix-turn-helix transcriptional regulator n=1 Tax=Kutzneria sp. NPDC051319 TaxID=3155047 RepID=UPI003418B65B
MSTTAVAGPPGDRRLPSVDSAPIHPIPPEELARFARLSCELATLTALRRTRSADRMGLSAIDHKVFDLVALSDPPLTAGRIAELTGLTTGAVTGVLDRLEQADLVRRARHPHDRRKVLVLSRSPSSTAPLQALLAAFSPTERAVIQRYLALQLEQLRVETAVNPV